MICPPAVQLRYYNDLSGPKRCHLEKGRGHMDIMRAIIFATR